MSSQRASGILLHPTSLPGPYGIGDLGPASFAFVDLLKKAGQTYWQILPLGSTGHGNSPYSLYSAFAGNTLLISPETLADDGLISQDTLRSAPAFPSESIDFERVIEWKTEMLAEAFATFRSTGDTLLRNEYDAFCSENFWWLDDYAIFRAVKTSHNDSPWSAWAEALRRREKAAIATVREQLAREMQAAKFAQLLFFRQWGALKQYANDKGIRIIGDIPIFVAHDSADVWCNQELFKLNADGSPKVVAGVPPDYFSETGQLWGNPIYDWDAMRVLD
ncbi:MAG: 4-alpha-glucanotransferase, partial [Pyrinomonadaceae bacterium]